MEIELEAELALGRHELIVGELEIAVVDHPYREGLWYLLIEALARSGRGSRHCEPVNASGTSWPKRESMRVAG